MNRIVTLAAIGAGVVLIGLAYWPGEKPPTVAAGRIGPPSNSVAAERVANTAAPTEGDPLADIVAAERIADPLERCKAYPVPHGYRWSRAMTDAFCADEFTTVPGWDSMQDAIQSGKAADVDKRLDAVIAGYQSGSVPEGALFHAYTGVFKHSSPTLDRLIARWLDDVPNSAHALAARGMHELAAGQQNRGEATIRNTSKRDLDAMDISLEHARADLEKAVAANPSILPAYGALIHLARLKGDRELAEKSLQQALKVAPQAYYPRAEIITNYEPRWGGSFEQMVRFATEATTQAPTNPRMPTLKARALAAPGLPLHVNGDSKAAMHTFEEGLAEGPDVFYLDLAQFDAGKFDAVRAVELSSQLLRFSPNFTRARLSRAHDLLELGREEWALSDLDSVLRTDPRNTAALNQYANVLIRQHKDAAAEAKLKQLITADPANRWARFTLAWTYVRRTHRYDDADALIAELLKAEPQAGDLWLLRVQMLDDRPGSDMRDAVEHFLQYADPKEVEQRDAIPIARNWLATHPLKKAAN